MATRTVAWSDVDRDAAAPMRRERLGRLAALLIFALLAAVAVYDILRIGRHTTFFYDEWSWIQNRRGWQPAAFLTPHNGHLSLLPVLIYHLLFETVGLRAYLPYRLVLMAFHVAACLLLYLYCRTRLGAFPALLPAALVLFLGSAYQDLLWPFQIGFLASVTFGLAAFVLLDRPAGDHEGGTAWSRRELGRDAAVALCLLAAVSSSGVGIPALVGAGVRVLLGRNWRRWWVVAAPALCYLTWYARYGRSTVSGQPGHLTSYFLRSFRAAIGGLAGQSGTQRPALVMTLSVVFVLALALRLLLAAKARRLPVDLLGACAWATSFWVLTALTRASTNDFGASRYLYPGGVALLLVLAEVLRDVRIPRPAVAGLAGLTVLAALAGQDTLHRGADGLSSVAARVRADLAALEHSLPAPSYRPNRRLMPVVTASGYRAARAALGSAALNWNVLPAQASGVRDDADRVLREAGNLRVTDVAGQRPAGDAAPLDASVVAGQVTALPDHCLRLQPPAGGAQGRFTVRLPASGLLITAGADPVLTTAHRFGPDSGRFALLPPRSRSLLTGLPDGSPVLWSIGLSSGAAIGICTNG